MLQPENRKVLAFVRRYQQECLLVVWRTCHGTLSVSNWIYRRSRHGPLLTPSRTRFPSVREQPYSSPWSAYAFYWFVLEAEDR